MNRTIAGLMTPWASQDAVFVPADPAGGAADEIEAGVLYVAVLHPRHYEDICKVRGRALWYYAWGRYRAARREGVCGWLPPRLVLDRFKHAPHVSAELGRFAGFTFKEAA